MAGIGNLVSLKGLKSTISALKNAVYPIANKTTNGFMSSSHVSQLEEVQKSAELARAAASASGVLHYKVYKISSSASVNHFAFTINVTGSAKMFIEGDGYFTDSSMTTNLGKYLELTDGNNTIYRSNGNFDIFIYNKYNIKTISFGDYDYLTTYHDLADYRGMSNLWYLHCVGTRVKGKLTDILQPNLQRLYLYSIDGLTDDISAYSNYSNLTHISLSWNSNISGNINSLSKLTNLKCIRLYRIPISGDISCLSNLKNLEELLLHGTNCTGNTKSLAALHPNNGGKLQTLRYEDSGITGTWPPT